MKRIVPIVVLLASGFANSTLSHAHKTYQARVIHILLYQNRVELYVNLLLPKSPKVTLWMRLFDRNRNRRLEPSEQRALGLYLKRYAEKGLKLSFRNKRIKLRFAELQNSRLRGDARRKRYSWDVHLSGHLKHHLKWSPKGHILRIQVTPLFAQEMVPVAVVALKGIRLKRTKTSYTLRRNQKDRAICKLSLKRNFCHFLLQRIVKQTAKSTKSTSQPTSHPTKPKD